MGGNVRTLYTQDNGLHLEQLLRQRIKDLEMEDEMLSLQSDSEGKYVEAKVRRSELSNLLKVITIEEGLVKTEWACPKCGERRTDWLEWLNDQQVICNTCQYVYELQQG